MSVEVQLFNDGTGLLFTYRGVVRPEDDQRANEIIDQSYDRRTARFSLIDNRAVTKNTTTSEEIRMIADFCIEASKNTPKHIVAVVAPKDISFGLGRMWQTLSEETSWSIGIYRDMASAEDFIQKEHMKLFGEDLGEIRVTGTLVPEIG